MLQGEEKVLSKITRLAYSKLIETYKKHGQDSEEGKKALENYKRCKELRNLNKSINKNLPPKY